MLELEFWAALPDPLIPGRTRLNLIRPEKPVSFDSSSKKFVSRVFIVFNSCVLFSVRVFESQKMAKEQVSYTVEQLVAVNPYNPDILSDLENYVNEQVKP